MQLREAEDELQRRRVQVLVVTFDRGPLLAHYVQQMGLPWPILVDAERVLYHAYGMERGRLRDIWGPASIAIYLKLLLRGRRPRRAGTDVQQLGGDVLVDPGGIVRLHHVGRGPADRPPIATLLELHASCSGPDIDVAT